MVINKCLVGLLVFCFKLLVCTYRGTSSFMTSALDALVFVQVCVCVCVWGGTKKTKPVGLKCMQKNAIVRN